jgi:hypothetical protein
MREGDGASPRGDSQRGRGTLSTADVAQQKGNTALCPLGRDLQCGKLSLASSITQSDSEDEEVTFDAHIPDCTGSPHRR